MTQHTDETPPSPNTAQQLIHAAQDAATYMTGLAALPAGVVAMGICAIRNTTTSDQDTQPPTQPTTARRRNTTDHIPAASPHP